MTIHRLLLATAFTLLAAPASAQLIVIDAGHGGSDPGAVGCGLEEADVVLDVSRRLQTLLEGAGLSVALTRSDDRYVGLSARADYANSRGAARFVSIHANANAGTPATGTETFVAEGASSSSRDMGTRIQSEMVGTWGLRDRGLKTARFTVLVRTSMPASLSEMGFINNCGTDAVKLGSPAQRQTIAEAHYRAILTHLGRSAPTPSPTPTPTPTPSTGRIRGVIFEDVGAGLEDTSRRLDGARVTVGGSAATTDATGNFSFDVAPGDTTVRAELSGFTTSTRTCTVSAGGETWCSVGLRRASSRGTIRGVVHEAGDTSARIGTARVAIGATILTTDAAGNFSLEVPAGSTTVEAESVGYVSASRTCDVTAGGETWCSVGLTASSAPPPPAGSLCTDTCRDAGDGWCDDGGEGSDYSICALGTDCGDCGPRASTSPAPAPTPTPTPGGVYAGLSQGGSEIPRVGLANPTLQSTLGLATEPFGDVVDVDGDAWVQGRISHFGGPLDMGVPADGTGAITGEIARDMNNPLNPSAATLAARPEDYYYLAMRWSYVPNGRAFWADARILLRNPTTGQQVVVRPFDWGPHTSTGRVVDMSPQAMADLGMVTDDLVQVAFAAPGTPLGPVAGTGDGSAPAGPTGTVHGVVFEEHPGGDTSHRVVGATVTAVEIGRNVTTNDVGYFQMQLPAGTWNLEARGAGFDPRLRSCEVLVPGEVWCSIAVPPGGGTSTRIVLDGGKVGDGSTASGLTSGGCSAGGRSTGGAWLFLLLLPLLLRRRRGLAVVGAALLATTGCEEGASPSTEAVSETEIAEPAVERIEVAARVAPFARLTEVETLTEGAYIDARVSPNGERIALSHENYEALSVLTIGDATPALVADTARSGLAPRWSADGLRLGIRSPEQSATAIPMLARDLAGHEIPPLELSNGLRAWAEDDVIVVMAGETRTELAPPGDRYFDPHVSPDDAFVVFRGLTTGLYLWERATDRLLHLGFGDHAAFSPDGRWLIFDRLEDDGSRFTSGSLYLTDLRHPERRTAPLPAEGLVHHPSIAGDTVIFLEGERSVKRARLAL